MTVSSQNVSTETNTTKLNRNERRKIARQAKKLSTVKTLEEVQGTIDGIGEGLEGGKTIEGTVDGNNTIGSTDTKIVEKVNEEKTSDRGRTTAFIIEKMQQPEGTTREEIISGLQAMFPSKELSAIKNTVGALMHVIPQRLGWIVTKTSIDEKDKRKMNFKITGKVEAAEPEAEKAA